MYCVALQSPQPVATVTLLLAKSAQAPHCAKQQCKWARLQLLAQASTGLKD